MFIAAKQKGRSLCEERKRGRQIGSPNYFNGGKNAGKGGALPGIDFRNAGGKVNRRLSLKMGVTPKKERVWGNLRRPPLQRERRQKPLTD